MTIRQLIHPGLVRYLPLLILFGALLVPLSEQPTAQTNEVLVEDPQLNPAYTTCPQTYWYPFDNNRGHTAYLTLNTNNPIHSTNQGEWHPVIPQAGYYQVEAYIAAHNPIIWCTGQGRTIAHDTTDARYSIHYAYGVSNLSLSQYPLSNQWLNLGEYYFNSGESGYVSLVDLNGETEYSTTISFSAMRFTFTRLTRPQVYLPMITRSDPSGRPPPDAGVLQAQGFDACHLPTVSEMQTWWKQSPYSFYAIYLGGIHVPSICTIPNSAWVSAVHQQGWSFIPTWVGPQAPCSGYLHKMSPDPAISYQEGRSEAQSASTAAAALGLTNYGLGGTVIYYDMEVFGGASPECRQAASAFMNGWDERLKELGNISGGYGAHNSYVTDWVTLANVPDDVWAASWYTNNYDPGATVFGISWLNGLWINHQRIRQYAGDHNESWGGIKFNIDSDVADGVVAMPPANLSANATVTLSPSVIDAGWLSAEKGWLVSENQLYWTSDRGKHWVNISPAHIQLADFLPSGQAWALSTPNRGQVSLYHSYTSGTTWESFNVTLPSEAWWPLQLQFTSPTSGWIVMQQETSQVFSSAILLKTNDGGFTWQNHSLPVAAKISFSSQTEGWLFGSPVNALYHTGDGGSTWQISQLDLYPFSQPLLPSGTTVSAIQANGLGWAATSQGSCSGEKSTPSFTCQVNTTLWQTVDAGKNWEAVQLPGK